MLASATGPPPPSGTSRTSAARTGAFVSASKTTPPGRTVSAALMGRSVQVAVAITSWPPRASSRAFPGTASPSRSAMGAVRKMPVLGPVSRASSVSRSPVPRPRSSIRATSMPSVRLQAEAARRTRTLASKGAASRGVSLAGSRKPMAASGPSIRVTTAFEAIFSPSGKTRAVFEIRRSPRTAETSSARPRLTERPRGRGTSDSHATASTSAAGGASVR